MTAPRTLFDKIWESHLVDRQEDGTCLIYIDRHPRARGHQPAGLRGPRHGRALRAPSRTDPCGGRPQRAHHRPLQGHHRTGIPASGGHPGGQRQDLRHPGVRHGRRAPGHRPHRRAGAGLHPAGHDHRLRRFPHRHPRRVRQPRLRYRHLGGRARAGDPDPGPGPGQEHARPRRGQAAQGRDRQGHRAQDHRHHRHRGRHRLRHRIRGRGDPQPLDGRPDDGLQHDHRGRRARRPGRPPTKPPSPTSRAARWRPRARTGTRAVAYWKTLVTDAGAHIRRRDRHRRRGDRPPGHLGHQPRGRGADHRRRAQPGRRARRGQGQGDAPLARLHGSHRRAEDRGHRDRPGVHRQLHQRPHRRPARRRRGGQGPQRRRHGQGDGGARLRPGEEAGGGRGPGQDLPRRGLRMARARLLDVPGDERRQAGTRRTLRLHPRTATSRAARAAAGAPIWSARKSRRRPRSPAA